MITDFVTAVVACEKLRVSRSTLYAYVSRGFIRTKIDAEDPRRRLYDLRDIDRIQKRKSIGRKPTEIAAKALEWGHPVLVSNITCIENQQFLYRGRDAIRWSEHADVEQTAALLWDCPGESFSQSEPDVVGDKTKWELGLTLARSMNAVERCQVLLPLVRDGSTAIWQRAPSSLVPAATGLLRATAAAVTLGWPSDAPIHHYLAKAWGLDEAGADILRRALVLLADYELNTPTFAARVIASTGTSLSAGLIGALGAFLGPQNGGQINLVETLFEELGKSKDAVGLIELRLQRGDVLPGFGDELAPAGDPRAIALINVLPPDADRDALRAAMLTIAGKRLTMDFALISLQRALGLKSGAAISLFAVARTVGFLAHILEQHRSGKIIRPRARYQAEDAQIR